jgi:diaminopimelate epimerase
MSRGILKFTKMQGLGNDFVVLDGISQRVDLNTTELSHLADRHLGVGCDQILIVEEATRADVDFRYRIFNADGSEVEQCGNGARCFVQFVRDRGLTAKRVIRVETKSGIIEPRLQADGQVTVDMGLPRFNPEAIPFTGGSGAALEPVEIEGASVMVSVVSMGNPHAVQIVDDVDDAPVRTQGPRIERHPGFPNGANAGYMQIVDRANIRLRVWERGAGETLSCGTGACAAVVTGIRLGLLDSPVRVATRGGTLLIAWEGGQSPVLMTGPATTVFEGEWPVYHDGSNADERE